MEILPWTPLDENWSVIQPGDPRRQSWPKEQIDVYDEYTWRNLARRTPASFAAAVTPEWQDLPHIVYVSDIITEFIHDRLIAPNGRPAKRLFLTMPPRHGKSFLLSQHVPAWYLSMFPEQQVILTTYEANFAAKWGGKVRDIIEHHGDRFGLRLDPTSAAKNRWSLARPHLGGMITAGMGGPITGEGGGLLVGDDWVKNSEEANSERWRDNAWDWYNTTFKTRFQKDLRNPLAKQPKMLLLMTRWHDDDPPGRLLERNSGDMVVIHLPALAGENDPLGRLPGEALCPKIMTAEELLEQRAEDPPSFDALYQGNPTPEEGGLFSKSHFQKWKYATMYDGAEEMTDAYVLQLQGGAERAVRTDDCRHFITVDLAISEKRRADFTVFCLWALTPERELLLVSRFRDKIEEAEHLPMLQKFYDDAKRGPTGVKVRFVGIEKQSFGLSLIKNARRASNMPIRDLAADQDKYARAIPAGTYTKGRRFFLPSHADWSEEFISECVLFPTGAHDDQVDTFAYAAQAVEQYFPASRFKRERDVQNDDEIDPRIQKNLDRIAERNRKARRRSNFYG